MVDASLVAGDVLKNLLGAHRGEDEADRAAAEAICHRLEALCRALDTPGGGAACTGPPEPGAARRGRFRSSFPDLRRAGRGLAGWPAWWMN
jgi:hypothetical protein